MTKQTPIHVGIIGFGKMGKLHANGYQAVGASIRWVLDTHADMGDCPYPTTDDIADIIRDCDVVSVCSPSSTHVAWAEQLFAHRIHTFVEKPLGLTESDCRRLVVLHKDAVRMGWCRLSFRAGVGHIERFNPAFQVLLEHIKRVGRVQSIHTQRCNPSSGRIRDADVVSDLTIHDLDLMRAVCGGDSLDCVHIMQHVTEDDFLDEIHFTACLQGVHIESYTSRLRTEAKRMFSVYGTRGALHADLGKKTLVWQDIDGHHHPISVQPCDQIISQMGAWIHAVHHGEKPVVGLTDGLFAVRASDTIRRALRSS